MILEDPEEINDHPPVPSSGLSPILGRSSALPMPSMNGPFSQTIPTMNRLSIQPVAESSHTSYSEVKTFVREQHLEECIAWLQTAALKEDAFQEVVDIARKGFPGKYLQRV